MSGWSPVQRFETALRDPASEWTGAFLGRATAGPDLAGANWIWYPEGDPAGGVPPATRFFRKTVDLAAAPTKATLVVTGDDTATVWVNGTQVSDSPRVADSWKTAAVVDVERPAHRRDEHDRRQHGEHHAEPGRDDREADRPRWTDGRHRRHVEGRPDRPVRLAAARVRRQPRGRRRRRWPATAAARGARTSPSPHLLPCCARVSRSRSRSRARGCSPPRSACRRRTSTAPRSAARSWPRAGPTTRNACSTAFPTSPARSGPARTSSARWSATAGTPAASASPGARSTAPSRGTRRS